jgi:hypothetical protein
VCVCVVVVVVYFFYFISLSLSLSLSTHLVGRKRFHGLTFQPTTDYTIGVNQTVSTTYK